jgi:CheY-like chemotaxis protein
VSLKSLAAILCAALVVALGNTYSSTDADGLIPTLQSLQRWTPFLWGNPARIGSLVPLLCGWMTDPALCWVAQCTLTAAAGLACFWLLSSYLWGEGDGLLEALVWLALSSRHLLVDYLGTCQQFAVGVALALGALVLAARSRWWLGLLVVAFWVDSGLGLTLVPLTVLRRDWRGLAVVLVLSGAWVAYYAATDAEPRYLGHVPLAAMPAAVGHALRRCAGWELLPAVLALRSSATRRVAGAALVTVLATSVNAWVVANDSDPRYFLPALVLLTPNARGHLAEMRSLGFAGYLVKPVRQSSLVTRLLLSRGEQRALPAENAVSRVKAEAAQIMEAPRAAEPAAPALDDLPPLITAPEPVAAPEPIAHEPAPDFEPPAIPAPFMEDHPAAARSVGPAKLTPAAEDGLRILLAEDNPINMMLIRELLKRRGHKVVEVTTGTDAVKAMAAQPFDLLLTDIHMPGMDGIEAARAIRKDEAATGRVRVPIVALTADAMETGKRACQEAGMDGFLTKPVDPAELEEMFLMLFPSEDGPLIVAA